MQLNVVEFIKFIWFNNSLKNISTLQRKQLDRISILPIVL